MLFLKYIYDLWNDHVESYRKQYGNDEARIRWRLERERFILHTGVILYDCHYEETETGIENWRFRN